jgi:hypothetical protein
MARPKARRIYEVNATVPRGWAFPPLFVILKTMGRLGIAVVHGLAVWIGGGKRSTL